ncbi:YicC/YloC family endoribonuclease [Thermicanus aegyptius]|uniref:YicC/YloC family endoribonuclease n=1 Tax=Thermicanus aegyptius TaxID=94009 RepID=UPI0006939454|nr:YicC/YloC family endoribonuclease [Thermicanus aegyptius]
MGTRILKRLGTRVLKSMTGFGRSQRTIGNFIFTVELRSVNHRYHEINLRLPKELSSLEESFRNFLLQRMKRGRMDMMINMEKNGMIGGELNLDWEMAEKIYWAAKALQERYRLNESLSLHHFLSHPAIFSETSPLPLKEIEEELFKALTEAFASLEKMRLAEGKAVEEEFRERIEKIGEMRRRISARAPLVVNQYRKRLVSRIKEFLQGEYAFEEGRLLAEVALFADRSDIEEELSRLRSHEEQFLTALLSEEPVGRKLDFILQEMNREVNTIGSKANDAEIARIVVDLKSEIEKIREQVQNIE